MKRNHPHKYPSVFTTNSRGHKGATTNFQTTQVNRNLQSSHIRALRVDEGNLLPVVYAKVLNVSLLPFRHELFDLGVDLVPSIKNKMNEVEVPIAYVLLFSNLYCNSP